MNKKFSTFLAGAALLGAISANAGTPVDGIDTTKGHLYQLKSDASGVLAMDKDGKLTVTSTTPITSANLASTLWCVEVVEQGLGKAPIFEFVNKLTGLRLDVAYAQTDLVSLPKETNSDPITVGGEIHGWAFSSQYKEGMNAATLYSYFKADSVIGLALDGNDVVVKKYAAKDAAADAQTGTNLAKFELQTADAVVLGAKEINTILGTLDNETTGVKLTFTPDEMGEKLPVPNPFTNAKFFAEDAEAKYVYVKNAATNAKYLHVDTAYTNNNGSKFLAFNWATTTTTAIAASDLKDQYKFAFTYFPSIDSMIIQVKSVYSKTDDQTYWSEAVAAGSPTTADLTNLNDLKNNFVTVQDLIKGKVRIITIANKKESDINFGYKGCVPSANNTSLDNDLYVIKNAEGKYLAVPLYGDSVAQWVTLDKNMDPWHMPAYQWVVEKRYTTNELKETSPITITNREFAKISYPTIQLYVEGASTLAGDITVVPSDFVKDPANVKANPYVGYRFLDKDSMIVTTYKLRYLHEFASDKYMGISDNEKDSVLYVGAKSSFILKGMSENGVNYGYTTANVSGLKQLVRKAYTLKLKSSDKYIVSDVENRYAVSNGKDKVAVFYMKENNDKSGVHYFALIDTASYDNVAPDSLRKVGVDDNNVYLKAQNMTETRTSAFSVEIDDAPLYRRFNNVALDESAVDAADSLRFYENIRHEYLMDETNKELQNEGVNYLGIWTADKAKAGLSFRIDTAWVTRGLGYIKPQYLISVSRNDQAADKGTPCNEPGGHKDAQGKPTDEWGCVHAKPGKAGFVYGKYLVSFADSVATVGQDKPYTDVKAGYTRVGFVKAIKTGDSLIVLVNGYENMKPEDLNVDDIIKAYKAAKIDGKYINNLKGDNHKNYTWSFRYTNPDGAANVTEEGAGNSFLIESNSHDGISIAPEKAAWIKMQNGCIVLTDEKSEFNNAKTGGDGALIFNVENIENDEMATDTKDITTSDVTVIAGKGDITIKGAAGKTVTISNVLGQTVANAVLSSNEATISAPAGIVVVAVEGEAAVKAIVK